MFDPKALLRDIAAQPRPVGSEALASARERCVTTLREMGFEVRERPFAFSGFPGRLGTPLMGGAGAALVGYAGGHGITGARWTPVAVLTGGIAAMALVGTWLSRRGVLSVPVLREHGVNVEATRGGAPPRVWLCAHLDSKSQPVPTLVRSAGIVIEGLGLLLALVLAVLLATGATVFPIHWVQAAVLTLVGALPVVFSTVGTGSPGALDNASGVATVIHAAALLRDEPRVGVLLTDAEELGLAGARAWAGTADHEGATVLNCDGVDDNGRMAVIYTGSRPARLLSAIDEASRASGVPHEVLRLIPGVLTDSVAFADAGVPSVTFSRGSLASLLRVHRPSDSLDRLQGTGVAEAATLMAATARELVTGENT